MGRTRTAPNLDGRFKVLSQEPFFGLPSHTGWQNSFHRLSFPFGGNTRSLGQGGNRTANLAGHHLLQSRVKNDLGSENFVITFPHLFSVSLLLSRLTRRRKVDQINFHARPHGRAQTGPLHIGALDARRFGFLNSRPKSQHVLL